MTHILFPNPDKPEPIPCNRKGDPDKTIRGQAAVAKKALVILQ
jgi:hypothetical protein